MIQSKARVGEAAIKAGLVTLTVKLTQNANDEAK